MVIEPQFSSVGNFSEGLVAVRINDKYGYIDKTGKIIVEPIFEGNTGFKNGFLNNVINGKWVSVTTTGKIFGKEGAN